MNENKLSRNTIQKQLVIEAVNALHTHPSAEEIYFEITKTMPNISKATVYRNLSLLCENGEVLKIEVPNASDRFDFNTMPHHHMKCTKCGKICDVKTKALDIMNNVSVDSNAVITGYNLLFEGLCEKCI